MARHVLTEMLTQLGIVPQLSDIENVFNDGKFKSSCVKVADSSLGKQRRHAKLVLRSHLRAQG